MGGPAGSGRPARWYTANSNTETTLLVQGVVKMRFLELDFGVCCLWPHCLGPTISVDHAPSDGHPLHHDHDSDTEWFRLGTFKFGRPARTRGGGGGGGDVDDDDDSDDDDSDDDDSDDDLREHHPSHHETGSRVRPRPPSRPGGPALSVPA
eukprot:3754179-Rhodomonas_salina.1